MRKLFLSLAFILSGVLTFGQGFDATPLVVEKISATVPGFTNATTYRIFVDMEDVTGTNDWQMQLVQGLTGQPVYFTTTTSFYNAPTAEGGATFGGSINGAFFGLFPQTQFDSWITISAATVSDLGVLTTDPADDGDGLIAGTALSPVVIDDPVTSWAAQFGGAAGNTGSFTSNVAIYNVNGGEVGPTSSNRVMIAQMTTDGVFEFGGLVQIRRPQAGGGFQVEQQYLTYSSVEANTPPEITGFTPADGSTVVPGSVSITVLADDDDQDPANEIDFVTLTSSTGFNSTINGSGPYTFTGVPTGADGTTLSFTATAQDLKGEVVTLGGSYTVEAPAVPLTLNSFTASAPLNGINYVEGEVITFTAVINPASEPLLTMVRFLVDGVEAQNPASPTAADLVFPWTSVAGSSTITVEITTQDVTVPVTGSVNVNVASGGDTYVLGGATQDCADGNTFCVDVTNNTDVLTDVTGFDLSMTYDADKVDPTGIITVYPNTGGADQDNTAYLTSQFGDGTGIDTLFISVFLDQNSLPGENWDGISNPLFCVEFVKKQAGAFTADFDAYDIIESTNLGISTPKAATGSIWDVTVNPNYTGQVNFWLDNQGIGGTGAVATQVRDNTGTTRSTTLADGSFQFDIVTYGTEIRIRKVLNNPGISAMLQIVGGYDAYLTALLLVNALPDPSPFQLIAMDVNRDGVVSAGDVSQINQRAVNQIGNYTQVNRFSEPSGAGPFAWVFVSEILVNDDLSFRKSDDFPRIGANGGYSKFRVPTYFVSADLASQVALGSCPVIIDGRNTFFGVLLGDVDGSWATASAATVKSATDVVKFDLASAYFEENYIDIPVSLSTEEKVNSLDFAILFNDQKISFESVLNFTDYIESNFNVIGNEMGLTSYSLETYEVDEHIMSVRFYAPNGFEAGDILEAVAFINGKEVTANFTGTLTSVDNMQAAVKVFPNPASEYLRIQTPEMVSVQVYDVQGRTILMRENVMNNDEINVQTLSEGIYMMRISGESVNKMERIVIKK